MPEKGKQPVRDYSWVDKLDTEQLERIIRGYFDAPEEENVDMDLIVHISEVINSRDSKDGESADEETERAWERFNELYRPLAESGETLYGDSDDEDEDAPTQSGSAKAQVPRHRGWRSMSILSKAACIALAFIVLTFAGTGVAAAAGYNVWDAVATWTDETFSFRSRGGSLTLDVPPSADTDGEAVYTSLQEALDAYGITVPLAPQWIPKEYGLSEVTACATDNDSFFFSASYCSDSGTILVHITPRAMSSFFTVEKDNCDPVPYETGGITHYIMTNAGDAVAYWTNGDSECLIDGTDLSQKDLKRIIDSIYWRN